MNISKTRMKNNIDIDIEHTVSDTGQVEEQYRKASPFNNLVHQTEPEMAQQVPQRD